MSKPDWWIEGRPELDMPEGAERFVLPGDWVTAGQVVARVFSADGSRDVTSPIDGIVVRGMRPGRLEVHGPANSLCAGCGLNPAITKGLCDQCLARVRRAFVGE